MSKSQIAAVARDFEGVVSYLKEKRLIPNQPDASLLSSARKLHSATYSMILWRFRLPKSDDNSRVFIEEIASDALQLLPHAIVGYLKTSDLLIRGIIENTFRHLYFCDHPIEYLRMNRDQKWYVEMKDLYEYSVSHPAFLDTEKKFDAIAKLKSLHSTLSATIHGRRAQDLEMRVALRKLVFAQDTFDKRVLHVEQCTEAVNFILATLHTESLRHFQPEDRRIILRSMSPKARRVWNELE